VKHLSVLIVVPLLADNVKFLILFCLSLRIFESPQLLTYLYKEGVGSGEWGDEGDEGDEGEELITNDQ
jgi:hypothetical protein